MIDCPVIALKFSHFWIHQFKDFRKNVSRRFSRWLRFNCHCLQATRSTQVASFVFGYIGTENSRVPWKRPSKSHRFWITFTMEFHVFFVHGTIYSLIFCLIYTLIYIHAAQVHRNLRGAGCPTDPDPSLERSVTIEIGAVLRIKKDGKKWDLTGRIEYWWLMYAR